MPDKKYRALEDEIAGLKKELASFQTFKDQLHVKIDFYNLLFETLASPIFIKDRQGIYLACNKAFEDFLGISRSNIIGKSVYDMGPKEIADKYRKMDDELFENGGVQQYEWRVVDSSGQVKDVIFDKALFYNDDQTIGGLIGVITDITHRVKAETELKVNEERFKKISTLANDAIIQMNEKGKISYWNPAAETIFGYSREEAEGKDLHDLLVPQKYLALFRKGFKAFNTTGDGPVIGKTVELTALKKDGSEFEIELSLSSYKDQGQWQAVGIVRDIEGRKQNERERDQLIENLKKALDEIKTLKGIVPICACCKKIRDDKGFWNHVETYVQEHSHAEFSHGICPECQKELYPRFSK